MDTLKDSEVWVVQYSHSDLFDCNRVCSTKDIAFASVLTDYARMNVNDSSVKTASWKNLRCLLDNEDSTMFEFTLEDMTLNLQEEVNCFIYRTYIF